jgi:hypothetical protein
VGSGGVHAAVRGVGDLYRNKNMKHH